jgi:purine-binding chemotaxis protein CheW
MTRSESSSASTTGPDRVLLFADTLGREEQREREAHQWEPWLAIGLDQERLAVPVRQVLEVIRPGVITRVPHAPYPVCGVTSLRGAVIAVVDLRRRLGLAPRDIDDQTRVVVVASRGRRIGLLVDRAEQVISIDALAIEPPPRDVLTDRSYYVRGVSRRDAGLVVLLALDEVLEVRAADDRALEETPEPEAPR